MHLLTSSNAFFASLVCQYLYQMHRVMSSNSSFDVLKCIFNVIKCIYYGTRVKDLHVGCIWIKPLRPERVTSKSTRKRAQLGCTQCIVTSVLLIEYLLISSAKISPGLFFYTSIQPSKNVRQRTTASASAVALKTQMRKQHVTHW